MFDMIEPELDAKLWAGSRRLRAQAKALTVLGLAFLALAVLAVTQFDSLVATLEIEPQLGAVVVSSLLLGAAVAWWRAFTKAALAADISASLDA